MKNLREDIHKLEKKIEEFHEKEHPPIKQADTSTYTGAASVAFRVTMDLVSGVLVGAGIGYILDRVFHTHPVFLVIFILLGGAAGFLNIYMFSKAEREKIGKDEEK